MWVAEDDVREILNKEASECSYIDYKRIPYKKEKKHDFVKDVIAMLNSMECIGKKKFIIFGVDDETKQLVGISEDMKPDDNEYQNLADKIVPRPQIQTGTVTFGGKLFGYVCILDSNDLAIYEAAEFVSGNKNYSQGEKYSVLKGQAFSRRGSKNYVMMQADRNAQIRLMERQATRVAFQPFVEVANSDVLLTAALVGAWNENQKGDCSMIELLYGQEYAFFQKAIREYASSHENVFRYSNHSWQMVNRDQFLRDNAKDIYDDHIEKLKTATFKVACSTDPFLDLLGHFEGYSDIAKTSGEYIYSDSIRKQLFCFWAFAGNNKAQFASTSRNTIGNAIADIIEKIVQTDNWKVWTTNAEELMLLSEAYPLVFLRELEEAIVEKRSGLIEYIKDDNRSGYSGKKNHYLSDAIGLLAMYKDMFSKAGMILAELGTYNSCFIEKLVTIMLPWLPQTEADEGARTGLLKAMIIDLPDVAWKVIIQLLPGKQTTSYIPNKAKYYRAAEISDNGVAMRAYWKEIKDLNSLACNLAKGNTVRIVELIPFMDDVEESCRREILSVIKESYTKRNDSEKYCIWNALNEFVNRHKKYADAQWALKETQLHEISEVVSEISREIWYPTERRLFGREQWELIEDVDNYKESTEKLSKEQDEAAKRIYGCGENTLLEFLGKIEDAKLFGHHMSGVDVSDDFIRMVIHMLSLDSGAKKSFAVGFINGAYTRKNSFLLSYLETETPSKAISVYEVLPISAEGVECSKRASKISRESYWKNVDVFSFEENVILLDDYVLDELIKAKRVGDVIDILFSETEIHKKEVSADLIVQVLDCNVDEETINQKSYEIRWLIGYVQDSETDDEKKLKIEWNYLELLTREHGVAPKTIYRKLGESPESFMCAFSKICKGDLEEISPPFDSNVYSLLHRWHIVPGTDIEGKLDGKQLKKWVKDVVDIADKTGRKESVENYIGGLLFYSPSADDGFFINREAASILNADVKGHMRNGYLVEAINSRGFHMVDETGETEFELERQYNKKAASAEIEGYTRLADTLRMIARDYCNEALHNIEESKKWKDEDLSTG